ncbi:MAG: EAL domain-containing protein [Lachnospiraceae bacterium]
MKSVALLEELRQSIQNDFDGFMIYYQPQVRAGDYKLYGMETLLRYNSKKQRTDTCNYNLIRGVIELAKANSMSVCCEGIETDKELHVIERLRLDVLQGYFFSKPCTDADIEQNYL